MNRALDYAENTLGVHQVHNEANELLEKLDESLDALDQAQDARRALDEQIDDRQMDLLIAERGKHADMSQAGMDRHLKEVYHKDETLRRLKQDRNSKAGEASGLELDIEFIKARLKVKVGRMEELGGYFQYLAAVKNAEASAPPAQAAGGEANETGETK